MTAKPSSAPPSHSAAGRRARFGAMTAILLLAATASLVLLNFLGTRLSARLDVTSTREHQLSPRTVSLLSGLEPGYEIIIAAPLRDPRIIDPRALQRVADVLDKLRRTRTPAGAQPILATTIDTGSPSGIAAYDDLLNRLADRDSTKVQAQVQSLSAAFAATEALAADLERLSPSLQAVREAIPESSPGGPTNRSYFEQRAAEARLNARALRDLAARSTQILSTPLQSLPIPDTAAAAEPLLQPVTDVENGLADIAENLTKFAAAPNMPPAAADLARPLASQVSAVRDRAAIIRDSLERLERLDLLRIARALESGSAALVLGPTGLTAVSLDDLFPPAALIDASGGTQADLGRNAEELLGTAIASLAQPIKPIVVVIHGQPVRGFTRSPDFATLLDRLALRGIDVAEWAASVDTEPPPLTKLDPAGNRPVVCVALDTDSASNPPNAKGQTGPERVAKLGKALATVIDSGEPLLLSLTPSTLPAYGEPDPVAAILAPFGIAADTARPLLRERFTPEGRQVDASQSVRPAEGDHPISGAITGLPTRLEWPIPLRRAADAPAGTTFAPLYRVDDKSVWAESQWLTYWQVPMSAHAQVPAKPAPDSERDDRSGSFIVAAAAERPIPGMSVPQRLVVVGANTWFMDRIAQERALVDGRPAFTSPGNAELFESAIYWLAGQDTMIAQSPTARAVPLIRPLGDGSLRALKWLAIAGLPALVLGTGVAWRLLRG